jgi:hypothetical protein
MNLWVQFKARNFLSSWLTVSFSRRTLLHRVSQLVSYICYLHIDSILRKCEGVSKSFRTGRLERELQMIQLSATSCSCSAVLWVSLLNFAAITLCVAFQRMSIVSIYFVTDSVRKILDTLPYFLMNVKIDETCSSLSIIPTYSFLTRHSLPKLSETRHCRM